MDLRRAVILTLATAGFAALFALAPGALAAQPSDGWVVAQDAVVEGQSLSVNGELRVASGATLTVIDSTVELGTSATAGPTITVEDGATLVVRGSLIRAADFSKPYQFRIYGTADLKDSRLAGLSADLARSPSAPLSSGFRVPWGGVSVEGGRATLESVAVAGTQGCAIALHGGSARVVQFSAIDVEPRVAGGRAYSAGMCAQGGHLQIVGWDASGFASPSPTGEPLYIAAVVATGGAGVDIQGFSADGLAISGVDPAWNAALVLEDAGEVAIQDVTLTHMGAGILYRHSPGAPDAPAFTASRMSMREMSNAPVSVTGTWDSSPPVLSIDNTTITVCPTIGVQFVSTSASATVDFTVDNVTVANCSQAGIYLSAQSGGSSAVHNFNVINSNASSNGQEGIYMRGDNNAAGVNALCLYSSAYRNQLTGIRVVTNYLSPSSASATAKVDFCSAINNTLASAGTQGGGIELTLGAPNTLALRYNNNTASGNGYPGSPTTQFGHYVYAQPRNLPIISGGFMSGLVANENGRYGVIVLGGAAASSRFDVGKMRDATILKNSIGLHVENGRMEVWTSLMDNPTEIEGLLSDFVLAGTQHTRLAGTTTGATRTIVSYKQVAIHAVWQNGRVISDTLLVFRNSTGASASTYSSISPLTAANSPRTDTGGNWSGWILDWIFDPNLPASQNNKADYAPVQVGVQPVASPLLSDPNDLRTNIVGTIEFQDAVPPNILVISPRNGGQYTVNRLNISGQVVDEFSGVAQLEVSLDGSNWTQVPVVGGLFSYLLANLSEGLIDHLYLRAWDRANDGLPARNESLVVLDAIIIDTRGPALSLNSPMMGDGDIAYTSEQNIYFQGYTDLDAELYLNGVLINHTGNVFTELRTLPNEGPQTFLFLAIDPAGNAARLTVTIVKDSFPPTLIVTSPQSTGDIYVKTHSVTITGITDNGVDLKANGVTVSVFNLTFAHTVTLSEGRNVVTLVARDPAGNSVTRPLVIYSDTVVPVLTVESPAEGATLNTSRVLIRGTVSETVSHITVNQRIVPVSSMLWEASFALNEGPNTLDMLVIDVAGNVGSLTLHLFIDTQAPGLQLIGVRDGLVTNDPTLTVKGSVTEAGEIKINGAVVSTGDLEFQDTVNLVEGDNNITVAASDPAGNVRAIQLRVRLDTQLPALSVTQPHAGATVTEGLLQIVGTAEPNSNIEIGTQVIRVDAQGQFVAYVALEKQGQNSMVLTVTDEAGNKKEYTLSVNYGAVQVDTTTPLLIAAAVAGAAVVGLWFAGRMLAQRSVGRRVKAFKDQQPPPGPSQGAEPGYTEPVAEYAPKDYPPQGYAAPQDYGAAPAEGGYDAPAPAPAAPPPRPPRPPRPPTN